MVGSKKLPSRTAPALSSEEQHFITEGAPKKEAKKLDAQEAKSSTSQNAKRSNSQKAKPAVATRSASTIERADGRVLRKKQIYFSADTARRLAIYCAGQDMDASAYVDAVIAKELDRLGV